MRIWVLLVFLPVQALAHHSTAMFDEKTPMSLTGVIKEFHWTNPHCSIVLAVSGTHGEERWNIQLGPPTTLYREDYKPMMYKPGTSITALVWPMRGGSHRALLVSDTRDPIKREQ